MTARDHSQTVELLDLHGFAGTYTVIGRHYGGSKLAKTWGLVVRAAKLVSFVAGHKQRPGVAVSHGSRSMVLAARWLRIPVITMYDYEWTETRVFNWFSTKVLVPDRIDDDVLGEIGLRLDKCVKYPGIKEEVYVRRFQPTPGFREELFAKHGVAGDTILAVVRPPATTATYHDDRGEVLFIALVNRTFAAPDLFNLIIPRTVEQAEEIRRMIEAIPDLGRKCSVLDKAVSGLDLVNASDLVVSGGGTMNREAALLGIPVYSIFTGRQGALDRQMERDGSITFIRNIADLSKIKLERRKPAAINALTDRVEKFVIEEIDRFLV